MSKFKVRALRAALVVPLLMGSALVASAGHASASINPDNVDRPKISAGDRDFGNKDIFGILSGSIVNWDETDSGTRSMCPKVTPWVSGILYVNNLAWQSTRVEVDYHDFSHNELHTWVPLAGGERGQERRPRRGGDRVGLLQPPQARGLGLGVQLRGAGRGEVAQRGARHLDRLADAGEDGGRSAHIGYLPPQGRRAGPGISLGFQFDRIGCLRHVPGHPRPVTK